MISIPNALFNYDRALKRADPRASIEMTLLNRSDVEQTMDALNIATKAGIKEVHTIAGFKVSISNKVLPGEIWFVTERPSVQCERVLIGDSHD